jgi:hypothetical protein
MQHHAGSSYCGHHSLRAESCAWSVLLSDLRFITKVIGCGSQAQHRAEKEEP